METKCTVQDCRIIQFDNLGDERGSLIVIEGGQTIPFTIERLFYIYGTDENTIRGEHANKESAFVLINLAGSCKVRITDTKEELLVSLDNPNKGVYIPKLLWKDMYDFSKDAVLLVISDKHYNGNEYIRDYNEYKKYMEERG